MINWWLTNPVLSTWKNFLTSMRIKEVDIVCKHNWIYDIRCSSQMENSNDPNVDPCGTPDFISARDVFF